VLAPLFAIPDIRWISLQYGNHDAIEKQILEKQTAEAQAPILVDRDVDQFRDIDLFAAQIAAMDIVVTIDNSTAHLAAALGIRTFLLLPFAADWRWLQSREDSPWYPTVRLFRQPERGDWASVVQRVMRSL
jgi:ADP-heptose:LPS heptosyltransferase